MERRKQNKQASVEKLQTELHEAINERKKLEAIVKEVSEKVNYDGGLVYKCDLEEFKNKNEESHNKIMEKLDLIFPVVEQQIEKSRAYDLIANDIGGKFKSGKFWIQVIVFIGVLMALLTYGIGYLKSLFKNIL